MERAMNDLNPMHAAAIDWLIRLRDGEVADWDAFTDWLEADPAHARAYDAVALANAEFDAATVAQPLAAANDDEDTPMRRFGGRARFAGGSLVAAALVALVAVPSLFPGQDRYTIATAAGAHRTLALSDGTRIALNGASRITLDRKDARFARLDDGEALFSVKHDPAKPFAVTVGDDRIQDVGTVFNVVKRSGATSIEVAEGSVLFNPDREAVTLKAGQTLHDAGNGDTVIVGAKLPEMIGSWRDGRLIYQNATLATVADDLSRNVGIAVSVDPEIATRQFTGVIQVERNPETLFARLSSVLGVDVRQTAKGWKISMRGRASR